MAFGPLEHDKRQQAFAYFYEIVQAANETIHLDDLSDEQLNELIHQFDFEMTLKEIQFAFAEIVPLTDQSFDDIRYEYLIEKHVA